MPMTQALYNILQAQASLEGTRATTADTQALAKKRMLGVLMNADAFARQQQMSKALMEEAAQQAGPTQANPTGPASGLPGAGDSDYDYDSPLLESLRSARQGVALTEQQIAMARKFGDVKSFEAARKTYDENQKEYRLALTDVVKDQERRNKEAAQAFGSAESPDDVRAAIQYVNDNLSKKAAARLSAQIAKTLPNLDAASPKDIQAALAPITNRYAAMGDQLRFRGSMQSSLDRAAALDERKRHNREIEAVVAARQAGVDTPISQETVDYYAAQSLKGDNSWQVGLARGKVGQQLIAAVKDRIPQMAAEKDISPEEAVGNKAALAGDTKAYADRAKFVAASNQFVRNIDKQIGLVTDLMEGGAINGIPAINRWLQAGRKAVLGDPAVTKLDIAIRGLAREHQRIVTGVTSNAQLHVSAQETADQLLNISQTPDQIRGALAVMREEAGNALTAGEEELAEQKKKLVAPLKGRATTTTTSAPSATPTAKSNKPLPAFNAKGWVLKTDKYGAQAYVSPDGKSYEEIK